MTKSRSEAVAVESTDYETRRAHEMEQALLGGLLRDCAVAWAQIKDAISTTDFEHPQHRLIFGAIAALMEEGGAADVFLVVDRLGDQIEAAGGREYVGSLYDNEASGVSAGLYAKRIRERSNDGKVVNFADALAAKSRTIPGDDALRFAQEQLERLRREREVEPEAPLWPPPIDLVALLANEPEKPRMLIEDWLPAGYAAMIAGHGGAGKSSISLHLAAALAQGRAWCGLATSQRRVVYLSCEDRVAVIHWRLARICEREGWSPSELADRLIIRDLVGHEAILYRSSFDGLQPSRAYAELARIMAEDPTAVLIVDGVSDTYGGNENDRGQVKTFVNSLVRLVNAEGAVLLVHHVNKLSAGNGGKTEGYSGSTGWHNSVRARWYLRPEVETDDDGATVRADGKLVLELQKTNHGRAEQQIPLRWDDDARMFVPDGALTHIDVSLQDTVERAGIMAAIREVVSAGDFVPAAAQGQRTALNVLSACKSFPESFKGRAGKRRFWRHIEVLRRTRAITDSSIRTASRHPLAVLTLGPAP